jgi:quinol monooxygenase YgiN
MHGQSSARESTALADKPLPIGHNLAVPAWLRPLLWPLLFVSCAALLYLGKVQDEMVDFEVYRVAAGRALSAEPLYRPGDGHYQFKYLPASALAFAPFAILNRETARLVWFALSAGLLTAFVRWSVRALPERRRGEPTLVWLTLLFMAKFYAHELTLGQTNILLGALLVGALLAAQIDAPRLAGGLIGAAAFVKPYALLLLPWLAFTQGTAAAMPGLAVLGVGLLLPAVLYGWTGNLELLTAWYGTVTATTSGNLLGADNVSIAAMWAKWLGLGTPATVLAALTIAAALALVVLVWSQRREIDDPPLSRGRAPHAPRAAAVTAGLGLRPAAGHAGRRVPRGPVERRQPRLASRDRALPGGHGPDLVRPDGSRVVQPLHDAVDRHGGRARHRGVAGSSTLARARVGRSLTELTMFIVLVHVQVNPEDVEAFKAATAQNARQSLDEPGVMRFDVLQQQDEPTTFVLVEVYRSVDAAAAHKTTRHYQVWRDTVAGMMASPRTGVKYVNVFPESAFL